jgi:hypothetical protein
MKTTITINNREVEIELTADQVAKIKKSASHYTDIDSLEADKELADKELAVIAKAVRQGNELGDYWYYPWFNSARSASGFSFYVCDVARGSSCVGSRLCVETSEKATYMGKQFLSIYNRSING